MTNIATNIIIDVLPFLTALDTVIQTLFATDNIAIKYFVQVDFSTTTPDNLIAHLEYEKIKLINVF